jgi:flavorubredoxin
MITRRIVDDLYWVGAVDWDRRLFDSLIPLPDGTSYNSYLLYGGDKTVLFDTVDPSMQEVLAAHLKDKGTIDYVVAHHAEQDHAGLIPFVLEKYEKARVIASPKCREILVDLMLAPPERIITVNDEEKLSLGNKTLTFIHTPWVHWPDTMVTYLEEDHILFTCDFFGSHLATTDLFVTDESKVYEAAKRYYAEIMMPFRTIIRKNLQKIAPLKIKMIAPGHGPLFNNPSFIMKAYEEWTSDVPSNSAVIPYVSMHGSTRRMVEYLVSSLASKGVTVHQFDLTAADLGKLAISLVDAATIIIGSPTVHVGPHPLAFQAAHLVNALRPKAKFATVIGSYGWSSKTVEHIGAAFLNLHLKMLDPVICRGYPRVADFRALENLAAQVAELHKESLAGEPVFAS